MLKKLLLMLLPVTVGVLGAWYFLSSRQPARNLSQEKIKVLKEAYGASKTMLGNIQATTKELQKVIADATTDESSQDSREWALANRDRLDKVAVIILEEVDIIEKDLDKAMQNQDPALMGSAWNRIEDLRKLSIRFLDQVAVGILRRSPGPAKPPLKGSEI